MSQRLTNLFSFVLAYVLALLGRPASGDPKRIFVVPAGKLGDVVCTTPVMAAIRKHLPAATLLVREYDGTNERLLAESGLADGYIREQGAFAYARALRRARVDTVVITGPSPEDLAAALIARVPRIIAPKVVGGYSPQETRSYKALLHFATTYPYRMGAYAPRERLRSLEPLGISESDTAKHLAYSDAAKKAVDAFLSASGLTKGGYTACSPSAGNKVKEWPPERFAQVAEHIAVRMPVVVIGTKRDRAEVDVMFKAIQNPRVSNACGKFNLDELKAFIASAALFVSVDTGPIYIAEAFGVPTVDITGPIDEKEQPPISPTNLVVTPPSREKPELYVLNARDYNREEALRQVNSITVEQVTAAVDTLLKRLN